MLAPGDIPVVQIDRGGQVTYHGPGQLVVYVLLNLERRALTPRKLVQALESAVIDTVAGYGVVADGAARRAGRLRRGREARRRGAARQRHCSYHGLAVNVAMDLAPFHGINPCGYAGLAVTDLRTLSGIESSSVSAADFEPRLLARLAPSC